MTLSVLQWNVLFREKAENIVQVLRELDADVLCLQELTSIGGMNENVNVPAYIAEQLGLQYFYQIAQEWDMPGDRHTLGNAIFSKYQITRTHSHFVRPSQGINPHNSDSEGRAYVEVDIALPDGSTFTIGTVHLSYIPGGITTDEKRIEIDQLLSQVTAHNKRYVFTGDLNETPESDLLRILETHLVHCGPPYEVLTWPTRPFESHGHREDTIGWRLDYVFATPDLKVMESKAIDTMVSDHLPVLTTFDIV